MNVIAMGISRMNALIWFVLFVIIKATLVREVRTLQDVSSTKDLKFEHVLNTITDSGVPSQEIRCIWSKKDLNL